MIETARSRAAALAAAALTALVLTSACSYTPGEPRADRKWANKEREVVSDATPKDRWRELAVRRAAEEEEIEIASLEGKRLERGERLVAKLGPGQFKLTSPVTIEGAAVAISGDGPEKTRLVLDTDDLRSLTVKGGKLELRDLTVAAYSGGGIAAEKADVSVSNVDFAGAVHGLKLVASTADVASSVFAGCVAGIVIEGGTTRVRGCAFAAGWDGIKIQGNATLAVDGSAFEGLRAKAIAGGLTRQCAVSSTLFAACGDLGWSGAPAVKASLVPEDALGSRAPRGSNRPIHFIEQFPDALPDGFPDELDVASIRFALERARSRGAEDAPARVRDALLADARRFARIARDVMITGDKRLGRAAARLALDAVLLSGDPAARDEIRDLDPLLH